MQAFDFRPLLQRRRGLTDSSPCDPSHSRPTTRQEKCPVCQALQLSWSLWPSQGCLGQGATSVCSGWRTDGSCHKRARSTTHRRVNLFSTFSCHPTLLAAYAIWLFTARRHEPRCTPHLLLQEDGKLPTSLLAPELRLAETSLPCRRLLHTPTLLKHRALSCFTTT